MAMEPWKVNRLALLYMHAALHISNASLLIITYLFLAVDDDIKDKTPLSKLAALKEDNMHLQLVDQAKEFTAKLGSISIPAFLDNDASSVLDLPNDRHGMREDLRDL
jgi:glutaredoxin-related protein